jgi:hypothetical protein
MSSANVAVWASGGPGSDYIECGPRGDHLYGDGGDDTLIGGAGKDFMDGGANNDTMNGGDERDTMFGRDGDDLLHGDGGFDAIHGDNHNDQIWGDDGNDELFGNDGDDDLYGRAGDDTLEGGNGKDGLFGGEDTNELRGGSDADRFLLMRNDWELPADTIWDASAVDATVSFYAGDPIHDGKAWTSDEIEAVDSPLAILHRHPMSPHAQLLKRSDGSVLTFRRFETMDPELLPEGYDVDPDHVGAHNSGSLSDEWTSISVFDYGFTMGIVPTIVEAIGLDWTSARVNENWDEFLAVSGWTQEEPNRFGPAFETAQGGWFYLSGAGFVTDFANTNPVQDWAATFAYFFLSGDTHPDADVQAKLDLVGTFLASFFE